VKTTSWANRETHSFLGKYGPKLTSFEIVWLETELESLADFPFVRIGQSFKTPHWQNLHWASKIFFTKLQFAPTCHS